MAEGAPGNRQTQLAEGKDTFYRGRLFRSVLEAKWAVFFDAIGIAYQYEPSKFDTPFGWYLPDFFLPNLGAWCEIKPGTPSRVEAIKIQTVSDVSGKISFLISEFPDFGTFPSDDVGGSPELELMGALVWLYLPGEKHPLRLTANKIFHFLKHDRAIIYEIKKAVSEAKNYKFSMPTHVKIALLQSYLKSDPKLRYDYHGRINNAQQEFSPTLLEVGLHSAVGEIKKRLLREQ